MTPLLLILCSRHFISPPPLDFLYRPLSPTRPPQPCYRWERLCPLPHTSGQAGSLPSSHPSLTRTPQPCYRWERLPSHIRPGRLSTFLPSLAHQDASALLQVGVALSSPSHIRPGRLSTFLPSLPHQDASPFQIVQCPFQIVQCK